MICHFWLDYCESDLTCFFFVCCVCGIHVCMFSLSLISRDCWYNINMQRKKYAKKKRKERTRSVNRFEPSRACQSHLRMWHYLNSFYRTGTFVIRSWKRVKHFTRNISLDFELKRIKFKKLTLMTFDLEWPTEYFNMFRVSWGSFPLNMSSIGVTFIIWPLMTFDLEWPPKYFNMFRMS